MFCKVMFKEYMRERRSIKCSEEFQYSHQLYKHVAKLHNKPLSDPVEKFELNNQADVSKVSMNAQEQDPLKAENGETTEMKSEPFEYDPLAISNDNTINTESQ